MTPNFEKLLLLTCACALVGTPRYFYDSCNFETVHARVLTFHIWVPHGIIADVYFFLSELCPFLELCPF